MDKLTLTTDALETKARSNLSYLVKMEKKCAFTLTEIWDFSPTFKLWREKYLLKSFNRYRHLLKSHLHIADDDISQKIYHD